MRRTFFCLEQAFWLHNFCAEVAEAIASSTPLAVAGVTEPAEGKSRLLDIVKA